MFGRTNLFTFNNFISFISAVLHLYFFIPIHHNKTQETRLFPYRPGSLYYSGM